MYYSADRNTKFNLKPTIFFVFWRNSMLIRRKARFSHFQTFLCEKLSFHWKQTDWSRTYTYTYTGGYIIETRNLYSKIALFNRQHSITNIRRIEFEWFAWDIVRFWGFFFAKIVIKSFDRIVLDVYMDRIYTWNRHVCKEPLIMCAPPIGIMHRWCDFKRKPHNRGDIDNDNSINNILLLTT